VLISITALIFNIIKENNKIEKNKIPKESPTQQN
jgi:hypothetical protein